MSIEITPRSSSVESFIWTIDENGERVQIPVSDISNATDTYSWVDSMVMTFDKGDDDE